MTPIERYRALLARGEQLQSEGDWGGAAACHAEAAALGVPDGWALAAWAAAGEAYRRADRPVAGRDALGRALLLGPDARTETVLRVQLSGCLAELGAGRAALETLEASEPPDGPLALLVEDARFGIALGWGDLAALEGRLDRLADSRWAHGLRAAQLDRLAGRLADADERLAEVESAMVGEGLEAGLGAVRAERAEIASLRGDPGAAAAFYAAAEGDHRAAGRAALAWRAEAGRVRAMLDAGLEAVHLLEEGRRWATERELRVLAIDLGIPLGRARRDEPLLSRVRDEALALDLVRRAGRTEVARAPLLPPAVAMAAAQDAERWLAGDVPWTLRASLVRCEALAALAPGAARSAAESLIRRLESVRMHAEVARAHAILD